MLQIHGLPTVTTPKSPGIRSNVDGELTEKIHAEEIIK